ncbi:hypothetical protein HPB50_005877 [Hyalomma asiaticum]|uniref:Uncharacterized protein n=1 Tax=Hyalomma asiaticum TaxID=266040 RepID=A0ACB7S589_HYAAI|nr:hypothetical protein HPB50_005877 [Hyalomma asiaticum]
MSSSEQCAAKTRYLKRRLVTTYPSAKAGNRNVFSGSTTPERHEDAQHSSLVYGEQKEGVKWGGGEQGAVDRDSPPATTRRQEGAIPAVPGGDTPADCERSRALCAILLGIRTGVVWLAQKRDHQRSTLNMEEI